METLLLIQSDVRSLVTMAEAVEAVEAAFAAHGRGETLMPSKVYLDLQTYHGDFRAMPAYFGGAASSLRTNSATVVALRKKNPGSILFGKSVGLW